MADDGGPRGAAERMCESVMAAPDRATALAALAETANDPALRPRTRATALLGVSLAAHRGSLSVPEAALEAIDDPLVVDAVMRAQLVSAITGLLALAPKLDATLRATRAHVGNQLVAQGFRGPHITGLLVDADELELAASAATDDFIASVLPARQAPGPLVHAWTSIALGWLATDNERMFVMFCRQLRRHGGAVAGFVELCRANPHADPALVAAAVEIAIDSAP